MIKVLLVDDEKLALEYLENIIQWEYYGFQVVGATMDAEQALMIYHKHRPELIISDVKMPGMTGIDLARTIRENDSTTRILFMSGYRDFGYVKSAISLDVDDYILKSDINEEIFLKRILKLKEEIEQVQSKNQYTTSVIMQELFQKNINEQKYKEILDENEYMKIHKKYYYLMIKRQEAPNFVHEYIPDLNKNNFTDEYELQKVCKEESLSEDINVRSFFPDGNEKYIVILEMAKQYISQAEIEHKMYRLAKNVYKRIDLNKHKSFFVYYYPSGYSVRQFRKIYNINKRQFLKTYIKEQPQVMKFISNNQINKVENNPKVPSITVDEIYQSIKKSDIVITEQYINIIRTAVNQKDFYTYLWYVRNMFETLSLFQKSISDKNRCLKFTMIEFPTTIDLTIPSGVINYIQYKIDQIYNLLNELRNKDYSKVVNEALNYIKDNYKSDELSLENVSKYVNLSGSWLSTKFKDEVGIGVSDYINNIRIQKAMQLFDEEKDYMVYEIAEEVGFSSSQYFSKMFKQFTGVTPNQYRRRKKRDMKT